MNIELYDKNNESKRDAFNEVARETRATAKYLFLILAIVSIIVLIITIYYGYTMQFRIEKLFISEVQGKYINITDGADDHMLEIYLR